MGFQPGFEAFDGGGLIEHVEAGSSTTCHPYASNDYQGRKAAAYRMTSVF